MNTSTWTLGGDSSCDVWIRSPAVAPVHCRLNRHPSGFHLEDLGSATGTTVNQTSVSQPTSCRPSDDICLAGMIEMPWPDPNLAKLTIRIGYGPENDYPIAHDEAVSRRHAMLILDPNEQILLVDCDSTNGTWIDNHRIKSVVISADEPFQVGVTQLTARTVFAQTGHGNVITEPLASENADTSPRHRSDWWYAGILVATLLVAGLTGWTLLKNRSNAKLDAGADATSRNATKTAEVASAVSTLKDAEISLADQSENLGGEAPNLNETDTAADPMEASTPVVLNDQSESLRSADFNPQIDDVRSGDPDSDVFTGAAVDQSMHLIVIETQSHQFDFAVAWEAAPNLLLTNAHVIDSLKTNQYEFFVVRVFDQWKRAVESSGVHDAYRTCVAELVELTDQSDDLREQIQRMSSDAAANPDVEGLIARLGEIRRSEYWLTLKADSYDVGWIRVNSATTEHAIYLPQQGKSPIQARKRLQLRHPSIESSAAYYEAGESRDIGQVGIEVSELLITDDSSAPLSWLATFDSPSEDWKYFLFDGCPIVDLRGGIAGMYRGPVRALSENPAEREPSTFHLISRAAIQQAVEQAESSKP